MSLGEICGEGGGQVSTANWAVGEDASGKGSAWGTLSSSNVSSCTLVGPPLPLSCTGKTASGAAAVKSYAAQGPE